MGVAITEDRLKELLKQAVVEVLQERGDLLRQIIGEAMEDVALAGAIDEGQATEIIPGERISKILKDAR